MSQTLKYPVSLALLDYAPVIATIFGQSLLLQHFDFELHAELLAMAWIGIALAALGGFFKATWKIIIAVSELDIRWMEHALFLGLGPGLCLFAWSTWSAQRLASGNTVLNNWLIPIAIIALFMALCIPRIGKAGKWFLPLIVLVTLSSAVIAINATLIAWWADQAIVAALFLLSLVISLLTAGVSRREATIDVQWIMEIANTASALVFIVAAYALI